jgi:hypothetical protein
MRKKHVIELIATPSLIYSLSLFYSLSLSHLLSKIVEVDKIQLVEVPVYMDQIVYVGEVSFRKRLLLCSFSYFSMELIVHALDAYKETSGTTDICMYA